MTLSHIIKRNGRKIKFDLEKITKSILEAADSTGYNADPEI